MSCALQSYDCQEDVCEQERSEKKLLEYRLSADNFECCLAHALAFTSFEVHVLAVRLLAMPLSLHIILNSPNNLDSGATETDPVFGPSARSQLLFTLTLVGLHAGYFFLNPILKSFLQYSFNYGDCSTFECVIFIERLALIGQALSCALYIVGVKKGMVGFIIAGAVVAGCTASSSKLSSALNQSATNSTPQPKSRNRTFVRTIIVAVVCVGFLGLIVGQKDTWSVKNFLIVCFSVTMGISLLALIVNAVLQNNREEDFNLEPIEGKMNPNTNVCLSRKDIVEVLDDNQSVLLIFVSGFFFWVSCGAQEAALAEWWLRRFAVFDARMFLIFILFLYAMSGLSELFWPYVVEKKLVNSALVMHAAFLSLILAGVVFAVAPNAAVSFIALAFMVFGSATGPLLEDALQKRTDRKKEFLMAAIIERSSSFASIIGALAVGSAFSKYLQPFTPDSSCVGQYNFYDNYSGFQEVNHTCVCGVEACPLITPLKDMYNLSKQSLLNHEVAFNRLYSVKVQPRECTLGQMTLTFSEQDLLFNDAALDEGSSIFEEPVPQMVIEEGLCKRSRSCLGSGLKKGQVGSEIERNREWCFAERDFGELTNLELGCPGFDMKQLTLDLALFACSGNNSESINNTAATVLTSQNLESVELICDDFLQQIYDNLLCEDNSSLCYEPVYNAEELGSFIDVYDKVLTFDKDINSAICDVEFGHARYNVCIEGPIAPFPGLYPVIIFVVLGLLAWIWFILYDLRELWPINAVGNQINCFMRSGVRNNTTDLAIGSVNTEFTSSEPINIINYKKQKPRPEQAGLDF